MDDYRDMTYMKRIIKIMEGVSQLRTNAKKAIRKAQQKIEEKFQNKGTKFRKGKLVLYFKKAETLCYDIKLEPKWKGPYQITQVLDKGAYKIALDRKELPKTVNGNLLKKYYRRSHYESVIIIKSDINREYIRVRNGKIRK